MAMDQDPFGGDWRKAAKWLEKNRPDEFGPPSKRKPKTAELDAMLSEVTSQQEESTETYLKPTQELPKKKGSKVTSQKMIEANQKNAQKSTGPKSDKSKAVTRLNAVKHGLLSQENLLPDEDPKAYSSLIDAIHTQLKPVGEVESLLVDRIASCFWRLKRLLIEEPKHFIEGFDYMNSDVIAKLSRYETTIERSLYRACRAL